MSTTSEYGATLIDCMGSDLTVVNAARVSFNKTSTLQEDGVLRPRDVKLIHYLASHNHLTPFQHPQLSFHVKAPIFVRAQLFKHKVGLTENEVSRRYVDSEPEIYQPKVWRKRADNVKQGSSSDTVNNLEWVRTSGEPVFTPVGDAASVAIRECLKLYNSMLQNGVCPEQARMVLPQSTMTSWIWTGSLMAFARVCKQRLDPHAQLETRWVAEDIALVLADKFPVSWQALMKDIA